MLFCDSFHLYISRTVISLSFQISSFSFKCILYLIKFKSRIVECTVTVCRSSDSIRLGTQSLYSYPNLLPCLRAPLWTPLKPIYPSTDWDAWPEFTVNVCSVLGPKERDLSLNRLDSLLLWVMQDCIYSLNCRVMVIEQWLFNALHNVEQHEQS